MAHTEPTPAKAAERKLYAVVAEFDTPAQVIAAARKVRDAGYVYYDAHSPFPVHGIDDAMAIKPTRLPFFSLTMGFIGVGTAMLMQWWMNAYDYPFWISGKPLWSVPSSVPVGFELMVLFAAFTTVIGMLLLNGLPRFSNPLLSLERFGRSTNDKFFISINAKDTLCRTGTTAEFLKGLGSTYTDECWVDAPAPIPRAIWLVILVIGMFALIPPAMIMRMRVVEKRDPRYHFIHDMDFQTKLKPQKKTAFFEDGRAERPVIRGTVARGFLQADDQFYRGLDPASPNLQAALISLRQPASAVPAAAAPAAGGVQPDGGSVMPNDPLDKMPWTTTFPIEINATTMARGQERYNIYCSVCHGLGGDGDGLATLRAIELETTTWVRPVSFHSEGLYQQPIGRLFHSITNGVRKMPGYGDAISAEDRWAILLYLRAIQKSRNSSLTDVPQEQQVELQDLPK